MANNPLLLPLRLRPDRYSGQLIPHPNSPGEYRKIRVTITTVNLPGLLLPAHCLPVLWHLPNLEPTMAQIIQPESHPARMEMGIDMDCSQRHRHKELAAALLQSESLGITALRETTRRRAFLSRMVINSEALDWSTQPHYRCMNYSGIYYDNNTRPPLAVALVFTPISFCILSPLARLVCFLLASVPRAISLDKMYPFTPPILCRLY
jgi:hypothetical protein